MGVCAFGGGKCLTLLLQIVYRTFIDLGMASAIPLLWPPCCFFNGSRLDFPYKGIAL